MFLARARTRTSGASLCRGSVAVEARADGTVPLVRSASTGACSTETTRLRRATLERRGRRDSSGVADTSLRERRVREFGEPSAVRRTASAGSCTLDGVVRARRRAAAHRRRRGETEDVCVAEATPRSDRETRSRSSSVGAVVTEAVSRARIRAAEQRRRLAEKQSAAEASKMELRFGKRDARLKRFEVRHERDHSLWASPAFAGRADAECLVAQMSLSLEDAVLDEVGLDAFIRAPPVPQPLPSDRRA